MLHLPSQVHAETCLLRTSVVSPSFGLGDQIVPPAGRNSITLETMIKGKPATMLQVVVWCPGYGVALIHEPDLQKSSGQLAVALTPLPNLEINAKVLPAPDGRNLTGLEVRVFYSASWICGFFGWQDCGVPTWIIARPRVGIDGALRFSVPDFGADPGIARVLKEASWFPWGPGEFRLDILPDRPPHDIYLLEAEGDVRGTFGLIAVANRYPSMVILRPHVR